MFSGLNFGSWRFNWRPVGPSVHAHATEDKQYTKYTGRNGALKQFPAIAEDSFNFARVLGVIADPLARPRFIGFKSGPHAFPEADIPAVKLARWPGIGN
jgi:hypothetical protein